MRELSLFGLPPTQTSVESMNFIDYRPISQITDNQAPIDFEMSGNGMDYVDLSRTRLYVKVKIVKADGSDIDDIPDDSTTPPTPAPDNVGPVNFFLHSMFGQIDVHLNDKLMSSGINTYPYKSYIQTVLKYGEDAKNTQLMAQLFSKDEPGDMDDADASIVGSNFGLVARSQYVRKSSSFEMEGPLLEDVFQLDRYLLNNLSVRIKLHPKRSPFIFMSNKTSPDYKLQIQDIAIRACMVKVSFSICVNNNFTDRCIALHNFQFKNVN